ncbi:hypothetical protein GM658_24020 [Pseudoduganella eburnea]|uniref:Uncharacterized protein n=1 Tax=Massilia eburnea TaxID=1776165 RepID=A0A6L6QMT1_9BURK|nr:hypothetical protein [Massilia eburnea]MTW13682.1 hypothetical protein [Massilia eburnea]
MAYRFLIACSTSLLVALPAAAAGTWCSKAETTYFSCKIKGSEKMLSVCGTEVIKDGKSLAEIQCEGKVKSKLDELSIDEN